MGYPNYPVRCVCFALVGVLFLLPVIFLVVTVNQPKLDEHVQWRESNCTLNSNVPPQMCFGEGVVCSTFLVDPEDANYTCTSPCYGGGALLPLKRDNDLKEGETTKCYYLIEGLTHIDTTCSVQADGNMPPNCGILTDDIFNDGVPVNNDPAYMEGNRPRNNKRQTPTQGFKAPAGCMYIENDGVSENASPVTFAPNGTATLRCIGNSHELLERLDYGDLALLLEGFFVTFSIISFIGVGLATFVEKTPNNDAYCFNFKL